MNETTPSLEFPLERIHAAHRRATIIVGGIASSLLVYVLVVEVLRRTQPDMPAMPAARMIRMAFFAVAVFAIFMATVAKAVLLRGAPPTPIARLLRLQTTTILAAALAELPAVLGLALFLLTRSRMDFYILLAISAYMIVRHFPQRAAWETYVRRGSDAR
jgi:hypothetical protein